MDIEQQSWRARRRLERRRHHGEGRGGFGLFLILVGLVLLVQRHGWPSWFQFEAPWSLVIAVLAGLSLLLARSARGLTRALFLGAVAAWFYACETGWSNFSFRDSWPWLLIALGVAKMLHYLLERGEDQT
ncbi:LiaF transmembrane domain-containing protein [Roseateles sp. DB2]|uniref:LiaF transmembrane domain-containing protein n=1 Tax=Roseateles sp. DB2 TaxID=3453717 RepID=UPI003EEB3DF4